MSKSTYRYDIVQTAERNFELWRVTVRGADERSLVGNYVTQEGAKQTLLKIKLSLLDSLGAVRKGVIHSEMVTVEEE